MLPISYIATLESHLISVFLFFPLLSIPNFSLTSQTILDKVKLPSAYLTSFQRLYLARAPSLSLLSSTPVPELSLSRSRVISYCPSLREKKSISTKTKHEVLQIRSSVAILHHPRDNDLIDSDCDKIQHR